MSRMYLILALAGWAWLVIVGIVLVSLLVRRRRGFEVVKRDEKQS